MLTRRAETSKAKALFIAARSDQGEDGPLCALTQGVMDVLIMGGERERGAVRRQHE